MGIFGEMNQDPSRMKNLTFLLHDSEEGRHNGRDRLQFHGSFPSLFRIHDRSQRVVQYPPPHLSFSKNCIVESKDLKPLNFAEQPDQMGFLVTFLFPVVFSKC